MKPLAIVAIAGLAIAAVGLGTAAAIGTHDFNTGNFNFVMFGDHGSCSKTGATATSRTMPWDGSDSVAISVPANVHYKPGSGTDVILKGDPNLLAHVAIHDGEIKLNCDGWHGSRLDITLPGREFREYDLDGLSSLDLVGLNQSELKIAIAGSADVTATGKVNDVNVEIAGRGATHLKDLAVQKIELDIAGRGDVETSPQDSAEIDIAGSGDVKLYTEPKHLDTSIMGSGNVEHLANKS